MSPRKSPTRQNSVSIAFEIWVDGEKAMVAGADDWSLLAFHLDAMRHEPAHSKESLDITLAMGALTKADENQVNHHLRWARRSLPVGTVVTIRIIQTDSPDPPIKRYRSDKEVQESPYTEEEWRQMRYEDFLALKAEFEPRK